MKYRIRQVSKHSFEVESSTFGIFWQYITCRDSKESAQGALEKHLKSLDFEEKTVYQIEVD